MTALLARRREVYRVYDEEEFLEGGEDLDATIAIPQWDEARRGTPAPASSGIAGGTLRRLSGAAMLVGALGVAGTIVAVSWLPFVKGTGRRLAGSPRARTDARVLSQAAPASPESLALHLGVRRSGAPQDRSGERPQAAPRPRRERRSAGPRSEPGAPRSSRVSILAGSAPNRNAKPVAISGLTARASASAAAAAAAVPASVPVPPRAPVPVPVPVPVPAVHPEFGFER